MDCDQIFWKRDGFVFEMIVIFNLVNTPRRTLYLHSVTKSVRLVVLYFGYQQLFAVKECKLTPNGAYILYLDSVVVSWVSFDLTSIYLKCTLTNSFNERKFELVSLCILIPPPPNLLNFKNNATKQKKTEQGLSKHKKWFFGVRFVLYATA